MTKRKRKPYATALITGAISITSYVFLLTNLSLITDYFTRGGYYAALPIVTAFYFSFVHGAFASSIISIIGLEPARSTH
jgi:hypothetical protein